MVQEMAVFTGNAHPAFAEAVCKHLEMPLGDCEVFEFSNENIFVRFLQNMRERDVFLIQPLVTPVSTRIMELLIMIDAAKRASAGRITAVIPYFAYGRSDKKDQPHVSITARLLANFIEVAGADRVLTVDLHAGQIQGFFNIPLDELQAMPGSDPDQVEIVGPALGLVVMALEIGLDAPLGIVCDAVRIGVQVVEKRLIDAIAFMRGRTEWHLDHRVDGEERDLGLIGRAPDLVVRDDPLGGQDHTPGRHRHVEIHEREAVELGIAVGVGALDMDQGDVGLQRRHREQALAGERAVDLLSRIAEHLAHPGAHHRAGRQERQAHGGGAITEPDRHMAPFLESSSTALGVVAHDFRNAPDDTLAEPAGDDVGAGARSVEQITLGRDDAPRDGEILAAGADQGPNHRDRRARYGAAANRDVIAVGNQGGGILQRHRLLAQAAVAGRGLLAPDPIGFGHH